ncbi:MAG TPA: SCO6880 family protein [Actinomycetota bacterium]|nr:SCO6880 family protein [Actinomycetota bacterium]
MTTSTTAPAPEFRTYGGWRTPGRPGLGKLGLAPTVLFFIAAVGVIACLAFSLRLALLTALGATALIAPLVLTDRHHRSLLQGVTARASWRVAHHGGQTLYRAGPTGRVPTGRWSLPGLAAAITATDQLDSAGHPFALLHHPHAHHVTAVIQACPEGASLVDDATIDHWVASWGEFLRVLGQDSSLVAASVTIETAPDPGGRLASELNQNVSISAPQLAQVVMADIARSYPLTAAITTARIALTWTCTPRATGRRRPLTAMAAEVGRRLPGVCLALQATGAGAARPMTVAELAGAIRTAYDPTSAGDVEAAGPGSVAWEDCGPVSFDETVGELHHDGAVSVSWAMTAPPQGPVPCNVLVPVLAPHPDVDRKRVTILFRPYSPGQAATLVQRDHRDALFSANSVKIPHAAELGKLRAAQQGEAEHARGAGLVRFGLVVTATVRRRRTPDATGEALALAEAAVDGLATASRLTIRRAWRSQATTFLAALPLGLVLPAHTRIPTEFKELL